jgi:hypothetical protein
MNTRKSNETLYQNNAVELNDEALAKVIGGSGGPCGGEQPWGEDWNGGNGGCESDREHRHHHCPGLLGDLLGDLL